MRRQWSRVAVLVACVTSPAFGEFRYDDGERHVLNTEDVIEVPIVVTNGSHLDLTASVLADSDGRNGIVVVQQASANVQNSQFVYEGRFPGDWFQVSDSTLNITGSTLSAGRAPIRIERSQVHLRDVVLSGHFVSVDSHTTIDNPGKKLGGFELQGSSTLTALSGDISAVALEDESKLVIDGDDVFLFSTAGGFTTSVLARDRSSVQLKRGSVRRLDLTDDARVSLTGGRIVTDSLENSGLRVGLESAVYFGGGEIQGMLATGGSSITMVGGVIRSNLSTIRMRHSTTMTIAGGMLVCEETLGPCTSILAQGTSTLSVVGSDFNYPMFDPITDIEGTITGTLADGNDFSWTFKRTSKTTIVLIPEPSAITLSDFGFLGLLGCRRNKNAA